MARKAALVRSAKFILAMAVLFGILPAPVRAETTIVIIRHGEKPALGLGQLTCQGLNRALALAPRLLSRYGVPVAVYAPNPAQTKKDYGIPYAYVRPLATIEPLAVRAGLPVNLEWGITDIEPLAERVLARSPGTQVVAWEHYWGEALARHLLSRLGGNPDQVPRWEDADFDSMFVIRAGEDENGRRLVSFTRERQGLDSLPEHCSDGSFPEGR